MCWGTLALVVAVCAVESGRLLSFICLRGSGFGTTKKPFQFDTCGSRLIGYTGCVRGESRCPEASRDGYEKHSSHPITFSV